MAKQYTTNFLAWDDATLGRVVKQVALSIADPDGTREFTVAAAAVLLIAEAVRGGLSRVTIELEGATQGEVELGNWLITLAEV